MRGLNRVRWVYAILAAFTGVLFIIAALTFYDQGAMKETAVAGAIGLALSAIGWFLIPREKGKDAI